MKRRLQLVGAVLVLGFALSACGSGKVASSQQQKLDAVRQATLKYRNLQKALEDGYRPLPGCIAETGGSGALGMEYLQLRLARDQAIDLLQPEQLFYQAEPNGKPPSLAGAGYLVPDKGQRPPDSPLGHMDGPIPGQFPGEPSHYELHVWIGRKNPAGILAFFNSDVTCPNPPD